MLACNLSYSMVGDAMTRFPKDTLEATHTQRHLNQNHEPRLADLARQTLTKHRGTEHHQSASLAAKDAEVSALSSQLNAAHAEITRLRHQLEDKKYD